MKAPLDGMRTFCASLSYPDGAGPRLARWISSRLMTVASLTGPGPQEFAPWLAPQSAISCVQEGARPCPGPHGARTSYSPRSVVPFGTVASTLRPQITREPHVQV
jgi:hypothetical protein